MDKKSFQVKILKAMKRLALFAWIGSICMTCFLFYHSILDQASSAAFTHAVKAFLTDTLGWEDPLIVPQAISFDDSYYNKTYYYTGEKIKMHFSAVPSNASKEVTYSFNCEGCSVDEEGYFTYSGTDFRSIGITATSVHDPKVKGTVYLTLRGIDPTDECVERVESEFVDMQGRAYLPTELDVGRQYKIKTSLIIKDEYLETYGFKNNRLTVNGLPLHIFLDGESRTDLYQFDALQRYITFYQPCAGDFTIKYRKASNNTYFDDIGDHEPINKTFAVRVTEDPDYHYKPTKPFKINTGIYDKEAGEYVVTFRPGESTKDIYGVTSEKDVNPMCHIVFRDEESKSVARVESRMRVYRKVNKGVCNLELVSVFDENIRIKVKLIFQGYTPTEMKVLGNRRLTLLQTVYYSVDFGNIMLNEKAVTWSIVEGEEIASLEGSKLTAKNLGKVVLRAQSVYYPEFCEDVEIEIHLFNNFYSFVRKIVGHFSLFAILGMGYFICSFFFLKKRRWASLLIAPFGVLTIAGLTELVQLYTPGRYGTLYDIFINFSGGLVGMGFVLACFIAYVLITKLFFRKLWRATKATLPKMSFKELWTRTEFSEAETEEWENEEKNDGKTYKMLSDHGDAEVFVLRVDREI